MCRKRSFEKGCSTPRRVCWGEKNRKEKQQLRTVRSQELDARNKEKEGKRVKGK